MTLATVLTLLVVYQLKHFLADYPLQTQYMLGKFRPGWEFVKPLTGHAGVHALFTYWIVLIYSWSFTMAVALALFDFTVHFVMDRIKAGPRYLGRFHALSATEYSNMQAYLRDEEGMSALYGKIPAGAAKKAIRDNRFFWWALGFDQMVHHLTHYAIIFILLIND